MRAFISKRRANQQGLTLLEMSVVLGILAATSTLIIYSITPSTLTFTTTGKSKNAARIVTEGTMKTIKDAILGTPGQPGYWSDLTKINDIFPQYTAQLLLSPLQVSASLPGGSNPLAGFAATTWYTTLNRFDPISGKGWRGPYIDVQGSYPYTADATNRYFTGDLYPPGFSTVPVALDGWGNPIIIQWGALNTSDGSPSIATTYSIYVKHARMVSAGPNSALDSLSPTAKLTLHQYTDYTNPSNAGLIGDDVVVFFFWPALP